MTCPSCGASEAKRIANEALNPSRAIYQCTACHWVFIASPANAPADPRPKEDANSTTSPRR